MKESLFHLTKWYQLATDIPLNCGRAFNVWSSLQFSHEGLDTAYDWIRIHFSDRWAFWDGSTWLDGLQPPITSARLLIVEAPWELFPCEEVCSWMVQQSLLAWLRILFLRQRMKDNCIPILHWLSQLGLLFQVIFADRLTTQTSERRETKLFVGVLVECSFRPPGVRVEISRRLRSYKQWT